MAQSFFFYDLETSGLNPREDRIMQFAGQRTDIDLQPIGESYNMLVRLNDDTLPSPSALLVTRISPQQTLDEGYTEAEFARILRDEIFTEDTTVVGFNNVRFDDEFIRYLFWRTFHDPYQWAYKDGRSRWDLLDVVRMTRALRPDGIKWPIDEKGNATNRLELLSKLNGIEHENAHDALSDVRALISIAQLIRSTQPQLFKYLYELRVKNNVVALANLETKVPFVYVSGRYENEFNKATISFPLTSAPNKNIIVYDLRYDPTPFLDMDEAALKHAIFADWETRQRDDFSKIPTKVLQYNRCPAIAPLGVLEQNNGWERIGLTKDTIEVHRKTLMSRTDFAEKIRSVYESTRDYEKTNDPEALLYDGFVTNLKDTLRTELIRNANVDELADFVPDFTDDRLTPLLLHYKARNYPASLSDDEQKQWEAWRTARIKAQLPNFLNDLKKHNATTDESERFILEELQLWAENILPSE